VQKTEHLRHSVLPTVEHSACEDIPANLAGQFVDYDALRYSPNHRHPNRNAVLWDRQRCRPDVKYLPIPLLHNHVHHVLCVLGHTGEV